MKYKVLGLMFLSVFCINTSYAAETNSIKYYYSNNTGEINIQSAYQRLTGQEQQLLQSTAIIILQINHMEQGVFENNVLGAYQMSSDHDVTADNTEVFITSPYQKLNQPKVFSLAKQIAVNLKQESVAVFMPSSNSTSGDLTLRFASPLPTVKDAIGIIKSKLPVSYSEAYSLHLSRKTEDFNQVTVSSVEWLGTKAKINDVKQAFPSDNVTLQPGKVFLIYKDGRKVEV